MQFRDRTDAGQKLAARFSPLAPGDFVVFGLARGGVPVAFEIAKRLKAPLEVTVARKLGVPGNPEFAFGAIAPGDLQVLDAETIATLRLTDAEIEHIVASERTELTRRMMKLRQGRPLPDLTGKIVILVDDGLATGLTALVALRSLRRQHPRKLILAIPVGAADAIRRVASAADEVVCLQTPQYFGAVGAWYQHFEQVSETEVMALLRELPHENSPPA